MNNTRRTLIQILAGGSISGLALSGIAAGHDQLIRPPGALHEPDFLARCQRCMRCIDVCVPEAIDLAPISSGLGNVGTPVLDVNKCIWCMECVRQCPSGALAKISKKEMNVGLAVIREDVCLAYRKVRRCEECFKACRELKAITLKDRRYPVINPDKCNGCAICVRRCPEKGSIYIDGSTAKRFDPEPNRFLVSLPSQTEPDTAAVSYAEWMNKRLRALAKHYGLEI